ncbi:hypothetical protein [Lacinutrix salivirga]
MLTLIFFTFFLFTIAQEAIPFKVQKEFYIYGDAVVIGNNILSEDAKQPFNTLETTNDDIDMVFVDIDNDESTFSSSSAKLKLPQNHTKIAYATLYWSATYSYEQGFKRESGGSFFFQGKRPKKRNINKIKFKLPNGDYQNITGKVEFDGAKSSLFRLNSPYVCSADVTKLLKQAQTINGDYTVANVIASKGYVSGGSAAGWLLYVVYEAPTSNPKYITTYNGFAHVGRQTVEVNFKDFKSLDIGEINTSLTIATLEGDSDIDQDECLIINKKTNQSVILNSSLREKSNFFNSKITTNGTYLSNRTPNSQNTLGFDIATLDIPKTDNPIINNDTEEITLAFNTKSDRFYLFFTAFQTEISKAFYEEKNNNFNNETSEISSGTLVEVIERPKALKEEMPIAQISSNKIDARKQKAKREKAAKNKKEKEEREKKAKAEKEAKAKKQKAEKEKRDKDAREKRESAEKVKKQKEELEKREKALKEKEEKLKSEKEALTKKEKLRKPEIQQTAAESTPEFKEIVPIEQKQKMPEMAANAKKKIASGTSELPVWLKQNDNKTITQNNKVQTSKFSPKSSRLIGDYLELTRENYKELLIPDDYIYETQTFKRVYNQKPTVIVGAEEGYYIINAIVTNAKDAIDLQFELKVNGINSNIIEDQNNNKFYIYLFKSTNFYDVFMQRKAFSKTELLKNCWIINIKQ